MMDDVTNKDEIKKFKPDYPYDLDLLPPKIEMDLEMVSALADARVALEGLKVSIDSFEHPYQLVQIPALQESVSSSVIENIRTTVQGAFEDSAKEEKDRLPGNREALNYREAIFSGWDSMKKYSLSSRTILKIHDTLEIKEARGFRSQQNSIIDELEDPIYTPPSATKIDALLQNWENFVNSEENKIHPVIKAIIAHYQFEAIHPFLDGNGRTGRILMVLQLVQDKVISGPAFYISGFLNEKSTLYKELLLKVTKNRAWKEYIIFMLGAFSMQAYKTRIIISKIQTQKIKMKRSIRSKFPKIYSAELIDHLFKSPVTFVGGMADDLSMSRTTAVKYLKILEENKYLKRKKSGKYIFYYNMNLLRVLFEKIK